MPDLRSDYELLGVEPSVEDAEVISARRRAALRFHPDRGGSDRAMARLNEAFSNIMNERRAIGGESESRLHDGASLDHDAPSFTISVLPVEAFEYLLVAAQDVGDVVDSDPPYMLEVLMRSNGMKDQWCRLELVPDAGSSTISLICEVGLGGVRDAESCRDLWVDAVNNVDALPGHSFGR